MTKRSKYATLDAVIGAAVSRRMSHRLIYIDGRYVAEELRRLIPGKWDAQLSLLSRRLQVLRKAGEILRCPCSNDWRPA